MPDYTQTILDNIHPYYKGWRKPDGAGRVNDWLQLLHKQGGRMDDTVKQFIKWLPQPAILEGFILEVRVAVEMIEEMPGWTFSSERQDGIATRPCDITAEKDGVRIDIQCKRLRNFINESFTIDFQAWVEKSFREHEPGLMLEIAATTGANEQTFLQLRAWLEENLAELLPGTTHSYRDDTGEIRIGVSERSCCGITVGSVWSPAPTFGLALAVDEDSAQTKITNRIKDSKQTFTATPGDNHFNLVAVQFPSMSLVEDDTVVSALYGPEVVRLESGGATVHRQYDGPFAVGHYDYCSAVLYRESGTPDRPCMALIPNKPYFDSVIALFKQFKCFRPPIDLQSNQSLFPDWPYTHSP